MAVLRKKVFQPPPGKHSHFFKPSTKHLEELPKPPSLHPLPCLTPPTPWTAVLTLLGWSRGRGSSSSGTRMDSSSFLAPSRPFSSPIPDLCSLPRSPPGRPGKCLRSSGCPWSRSLLPPPGFPESCVAVGQNRRQLRPLLAPRLGSSLLFRWDW